MLNLEHFKFINSIIVILDQLLERDVQIRAAYQWLDAQSKGGGPLQEDHNLEQLIEDWTGLDITDHDVSVAAGLHRTVSGGYPFLEIEPSFTFPSSERLRLVGASFDREDEEQPLLSSYHCYELAHYGEGEEPGTIHGFERQRLPEAAIEPRDFCGQHGGCLCCYCVDER